MPYIGKSPQHGNYSKLDDFSGDFDGSDATHALASNSIAITPVRPEALLISINGVIQEPVTDYTVSGTNITFTTAPASTDSFFGVALGEQLAIGTPSDATVTSAKLSGNLTTPGTLTITDSALISGSTPTLTIGDAGAEDTKIVFDGNAQDYHIGLDDTADDLVIGLGSTLGTTTHMAFDETGAVIKPLQPSFLATGTASTNVTGGGQAPTVGYGTEVFDQNADYDGTNTFTAPVGGKYVFFAQVELNGVTTSHVTGYLLLNTSNRNYTRWVHPSNLEAGSGGNMVVLRISAIADMDASDTAHVVLYIAEGSQVVDVTSTVDRTFFSGALLA